MIPPAEHRHARAEKLRGLVKLAGANFIRAVLIRREFGNAGILRFSGRNAFRELAGVPMVLHTSFNENEPVVCDEQRITIND